jgi:hypothetical protein
VAAERAGEPPRHAVTAHARKDVQRALDRAYPVALTLEVGRQRLEPARGRRAAGRAEGDVPVDLDVVRGLLPERGAAAFQPDLQPPRSGGARRPHADEHPARVPRPDRLRERRVGDVRRAPGEVTPAGANLKGLVPARLTRPRLLAAVLDAHDEVAHRAGRPGLGRDLQLDRARKGRCGRAMRLVVAIEHRERDVLDRRAIRRRRRGSAALEDRRHRVRVGVRQGREA